MTREEAINIMKVIVHMLEEKYDTDRVEDAVDMAIKALETLEEFEKAQIITGGRLNGRTYAYKCGLEDGKRKALEQEPCGDCISRAELLKAVDTWDKFGCDADTKLVPAKDCYVPYIHYDDVVKAIKGMPSIQPTAKENLVVGDCISRKAVTDYIKDCTVDLGCVNGTNMVLDVISNMPSIQPKSKTDEPMQVELEGDGYSDGELVYDYGKCPKCGWDFEYGDKDWEEPYCCHCGQRLKWFESEDEE